jgi:hypothetical protein
MLHFRKLSYDKVQFVRLIDIADVFSFQYKFTSIIIITVIMNGFGIEINREENSCSKKNNTA